MFYIYAASQTDLDKKTVRDILNGYAKFRNRCAPS
jgi:hypothetical protein